MNRQEAEEVLRKTKERARVWSETHLIQAAMSTGKTTLGLLHTIHQMCEIFDNPETREACRTLGRTPLMELTEEVFREATTDAS